MKVAVLTMSDAVGLVFDWAAVASGRSVCVSNVHMCMEVFDNQDYAKVVNGADLVIADGRPIFVAQRLLSVSAGEQIRGEDLVLRICSRAAASGFSVGFFGSTDVVLERLICRLKEKYPGLDVGFSLAPPHATLESLCTGEYSKSVNESEVQILFVGLGCPKQELWMHSNRDKLNCVMVGVGAAFDFISGAKPRSPRWMQVASLEWLFRFLCEPKRLWRRYFIGNPRFAFHLGRQILGKKVSGA